jgi:hypothetical protein
MRERDGLSLAQQGEIDPAGSSMSLATLGMRGVAATMLWIEALHAKKTEQFDHMKAALNQIVKLHPHFTSVWRFQSWELAYNIAAEFDDYRHRYHWVKKGFDFLMQGIRYNRDEPMLRWEVGWFFGHKLGRSDDRRQFRQLFREDDDFHRSIPMDIEQIRGVDGYPDNWLAAWLWYRGAQQIVDTKNVPVRGKNTLVFHSDPALALIYYAIATIDDGHLDEKGRAETNRDITSHPKPKESPLQRHLHFQLPQLEIIRQHPLQSPSNRLWQGIEQNPPRIIIGSEYSAAISLAPQRPLNDRV